MNIDKILKMTIKHDDYIDQYLQDKETQRLWLENNLKEFIKDGNINAFIHSMECIIRARGRGSITAMAKTLKMDRSNLSEILHNKKRPHIETVFKLIEGLGYQFSVQLKTSSRKRTA